MTTAALHRLQIIATSSKGGPHVSPPQLYTGERHRLYSIKTVVIKIWQITQTASLLSTPRAKVKVNTQMEMKRTWAETAASQLCWWSPPRWDNCSVYAKKTNNRLINDNCIISVEWPQSKHLFKNVSLIVTQQLQKKSLYFLYHKKELCSK